jgi:hypothetical protein
MAYGSVLTDVVQSSVTGTPPQFNDGNGTQTGTLCRSWVNFGYVSSAMVTNGSFNVSSVTRASTGIYTINFTNALSDANYAILSSGVVINGQGSTYGFGLVLTSSSTSAPISKTTTSVQVSCQRETVYDIYNASIGIFR